MCQLAAGTGLQEQTDGLRCERNVEARLSWRKSKSTYDFKYIQLFWNANCELRFKQIGGIGPLRIRKIDFTGMLQQQSYNTWYIEVAGNEFLRMLCQ